MEIFKIEVREVLARIVEVEAESLRDAVDQVYEQYKQEDIVLDETDLKEMDVLPQSEKEEEKNLINDIVEYFYEEEKRHFEEFHTVPDNHIFFKINRLKSILANS